MPNLVRSGWAAAIFLLLLALALSLTPLSAAAEEPSATSEPVGNVLFKRIKGARITVGARASQPATAAAAPAPTANRTSAPRAKAVEQAPAPTPTPTRGPNGAIVYREFNDYLGQGYILEGRLLRESAAPEPTASPTNPTGPSRDQAANWVAEVVATMEVPSLEPQFGPDPMVNEWKMLAVGFPIWLWVEDPGVLTTTASTAGMDASITVRLAGTNFDMGDGEIVPCRVMYRYTNRDPAGSKSPVCGYTYFKKGDYTVTASTLWVVDWTAAGYSGQLVMETSGSRPLKIGELRAVVTG